MKHIQRYQSEETLKLLGDSTRLAILKLLLARPATITQLGLILDKHPAQIRNHIMQLQKAGMISLHSVEKVKNYQEKYYQATARSFFVNLAIFPEPGNKEQIVILGSDDPALELLARMINERYINISLYTLPVGSLEGLIYLRENYCQVSSCHLFDIESGEYNQPYVRHLFTDRTMVLVTLVLRQQGLIIPKGNPKDITGLTDLTRPDIKFANRNRGAGTRLWLEQQLRKLNIKPDYINGYDVIYNTHKEVAAAVASDQADVGLGISIAAQQIDLDFLPLFDERYDLVTTEHYFKSPGFQQIMEMLASPNYKIAIDNLGGYNTSQMGKIYVV